MNSDKKLQSAGKDLNRQIKRLTKQKSDCSHKLGQAMKSGEDVEPLRSEMLAIKAELKALKKRLRSEESTGEKDALKKETENTTPPRFIHNPYAGSQPGDSFRVIPFSREWSSAWDRFVSRHANSTPYHYCSFRQVIQKVFGKPDYSLLAVNTEGQVQGVLPLVRLKSRLFGDFLVSVPYFNYGGVLALSEPVEEQLLATAKENCIQMGVEHMEIREMKNRENMAVRTDKVSMVLKLPDSFESLLAQLGSKVRAQVRRAERENITIRTGGVELVDAFYRVFARNMRDLGTPVYHPDLFRSLLDIQEVSSCIIVVELDGKAVAAAFLIGYRDILEIPWASSLKETNKHGINMCLYANVLKYAIKHNYEYFDFGRSSIDSGTYRFKAQWGARPYQNYWHYWLRDSRELPALNHSNPKFELAVAVWKRLPVALTNILGPGIVRNLP